MLATLERHLLRDVGRAIADFGLLAEGDRVMVCLSGGKDSYTMLHLLRLMQRRAPVNFELVAVHLDQGQPGYDGAPLREWLVREGYEHRIVREDTYSVVVDKVTEGKTYCSLCSRLRRGILYNTAEQLGATRVALGHHRDDALETLLLNLFFSGRLSSMPARLRSDDGRNEVIRPLIYCAEDDIARYAAAMAFPIMPCNLCGSQPQAQRKNIKDMLSTLEQQHPQLKQTMLAALGNVVPSHLLDRSLPGALGAAPASEGAKKPVSLRNGRHHLSVLGADEPAHAEPVP